VVFKSDESVEGNQLNRRNRVRLGLRPIAYADAMLVIVAGVESAGRAVGWGHAYEVMGILLWPACLLFFLSLWKLISGWREDAQEGPREAAELSLTLALLALFVPLFLYCFLLLSGGH
jgi:hypothetical protein